MLTLEQVRKLINDPTITDDEALEIRDALYQLAEIIFEKWQLDIAKEKKDIEDESAKDAVRIYL